LTGNGERLNEVQRLQVKLIVPTQRLQEITTAILRAMCFMLRAVDIMTVRTVWRALGVSRKLRTLGLDLVGCLDLRQK